MSTSHAAAPVKRPLIARTVRTLAIPIVFFWLGLAVLVNIIVPQLEVVGETHSVAMSPQDAPSLIAMKRIGYDFRQYDSDTTAMVVIEGKEKLGHIAHRYYDALIQKLSADAEHVEHIDNFWGDAITAAGSQSTDGKSAYVQLYLRGSLGDTQANESVAAVQHDIASVPAPAGIHGFVTGPGPLAADRIVYSEGSMHTITGVTVLVITIMLLFAYRRFSTVLFMLLTVAVILMASRGLNALLGNMNAVELSTYAIQLVVSLSIAAGTDYMIFLVGRYQEARSVGEDPEQAYYTMFRGTAHVILGSGSTVAGAMLCLSLARLPYFRTLGVPCALGLMVVVAGSLTLAPAVITLACKFHLLESRRKIKGHGWRRVGTIVVTWPKAVLVATAIAALVGLLALPKYEPNYNDRYYIPGDTPSSVGYHASDRHFPEARIEPEVLMVETDHDLRTPADMLVLDRIAKNVFHLPGIARVQSITRPLGAPIDHSSIPFQISLQNATVIENLGYLKERMSDLLKTTEELDKVIAITKDLHGLTDQLVAASQGLTATAHRIEGDTDELRNRIADFDDVFRPLRSYFYWEKHCFDIPVCWAFRSLYDATDSVDLIDEDIHSLTGNLDNITAILPKLSAELPPLIASLKIVRGYTVSIYSTFNNLVGQFQNLTTNSTAMGQAFDNSRNDDSFYLPPEAFDNPEFQRGLVLFLSPDGHSARFIVTHQGDPATAQGISHIDMIRGAAQEAIKGTSLETATFYLGGTAATFKDMHDGAQYDLLIAGMAALCLIFMIMLLITRSLLAAAVIVGTVVLSLGSSFGLSVLIWQHLLHMPLNWLTLAVAVIVLLAVGSDYNLLLVSRFKEERDAGLRTGIIRAVAGSGRVVTTAGLVFAFTMGSMIISDLRIIGQIGTTIMLGLLFDTLIVRSFMTPAIAAILGPWFWWPQTVRRRAPSGGPQTTTQPSRPREPEPGDGPPTATTPDQVAEARRVAAAPGTVLVDESWHRPDSDPATTPIPKKLMRRRADGADTDPPGPPSGS